MGFLRFEDDNEFAFCEHWMVKAEQEDDGDGGFCGAPSTSVVLPRGDWKGARPFCAEHVDFNPKYWIAVDWKLAHRIQTQMAAIEVLEDVAYWTSTDALSDLVGEAEIFSMAAQHLTARLRSTLPPTEPDKAQ